MVPLIKPLRSIGGNYMSSSAFFYCWPCIKAAVPPALKALLPSKFRASERLLSISLEIVVMP